uniref:PINIT domain-containing protein n=1 Tax=Steinernema glaseri TaxID=37863 RepID=A0A1I8A717_9BILA
MLQQYRVNELHILLGYFKAPKLGKKHELLQRCYSFLQNPRYQREFVQKIREVSATQTRYNAYPQAYQARQPNAGSTYGGSVSWTHNANQMGTFRPPEERQLQSMLIGSSSGYQVNGGSNGFASPGGSTHRVKNLKIGKLPFFDVKDVILELKELPGTVAGMQQPSSKMQFEFDVHPSVQGGLVRNESMPLPRKELQLRFFSADNSSVEQFDAFPPNCAVRIDGHGVVLPNVIPTNKPNMEPKSRHLNLLLNQLLLHTLLGYFKAPKLGTKHDLLQHCYSLLPKPNFVQVIRAINCAKKLKVGKLPLFDVKDVIMALRVLPGTVAGLKRPSSKMQFEFDVHPSVQDGLVRNESTPLPRKELQLRFFQADNNSVEQFDAFPPNCAVWIDDREVILPVSFLPCLRAL